MASSRTCTVCGSPLPEHLTSGTCPSCGVPQGTVETPKGSATPPNREQDFIVGSASELTGSHHQALTQQASTLVAERPTKTPAVIRVPPDLPNYHRIEWLNHGGMGDVYKAIQNGTQRTVAIKVMRAAVATIPLNHERFQNEVLALGRVEHRGVVRVYEYGECAAGPFFSMEFVDGQTLSQLVKANGPLPPSDAAIFIRKAAEAVQAAHAVDVLHRDLKPSNIMLTADGEVKVTDFGLAKHTGDDGDDLTHTGVIIGTPNYMAPEQATSGTIPLGPTVDIYGLGGTLYYLLTGLPPHTATTHARTIRLVTEQAVVPPRTHRADLCPILDAIVQKSLARVPHERYTSAEQFAQELENWLNHRPTIAVPPTRLQKIRRYVTDRRRVAAVLLLLPLLIGGAAVVRRELDPKVQLDRKLVRGEMVELIGATGKPRWHDWILKPSNLIFSDRGDNTASFYSQRYTGLTLVEDPMHDHYRFRADIRHLGGMRSGDTETKTTNRLGKFGLFWGWHKIVRDGVPAEVMFTLDFSDVSWRTPTDLKGDDKPHLVRVHARKFVDLPPTESNNTATLKSPETGITPPHEFVSKEPRQEIWRGLEIEVHPEECKFFWQETETDGKRMIARLTAEQLNNALEAQVRGLEKYHAAEWGPAPKWTPRRPLGIYGQLSTASFRNVVIEPLSPSP